MKIKTVKTPNLKDDPRVADMLRAGVPIAYADPVLQKKKMSEIKEVAKAKGGSCQSPFFLGEEKHLKWSCKAGHIFTLSPNFVLKDAWCKRCVKNEEAKNKQQNRFQAIQEEVLSKFGGKVFFRDSKDRDWLWECSQGHRWKMRAAQFEKGAWCSKCDPKLAPHTASSVKEPKVFSVARALIKKRRGEYIDSFPKDRTSVVRWKCEKGHTFSLSLDQIKSGSWCNLCRMELLAAPVLEVATRIAGLQGGTFLGPVVDLDDRKNYKWRCKSGHEFAISILDARRGEWCKQCENQKILAEKLAEAPGLAEKNFGVFLGLSKRQQPGFRWKCTQGHGFTRPIEDVKAGKWCRKCDLNGIPEEIRRKMRGR